MKREVNLWDYAGKILEATGKGVLLTTKCDGKVNTMTIGWGTLGIEWGKPICTVFVRQSRYTKEFLDKTGVFTVNVPLDGCDKNIIAVCGSKSGRDMDKIRELGLDLEEGETVDVPGVRQLPLTLECKVLYQQDQVLSAIEEGCRNRYYAAGTPNENDYHTAYYGLVTKAYIVEE